MHSQVHTERPEEGLRISVHSRPRDALVDFRREESHREHASGTRADEREYSEYAESTPRGNGRNIVSRNLHRGATPLRDEHNPNARGIMSRLTLQLVKLAQLAVLPNII